MQGYLGFRPQLERGALGSVIAAGVKMKLLAIWFCGNRSMAEGASEDRLPRDCLPAETDDRVGWRKRSRGGGGWGSTEVGLMVVVAVALAATL